MTNRNDSRISSARPSVRLEQFLIETDGDHQVEYRSRSFDLGKPTEEVVGSYGARGSIVWVAVAKESDVEENGAAIHHVVVDSSTLGNDVEAMTAAIEQLTVVRDQLARLQFVSAA